jgi:glycerophosphodiester phosphodiesterase
MLEFNTGRIALGGHRGCGMNVWEPTGPAPIGRARRYRENTVSSLLAAAQLGATFCEFDVQITADSVAVIFHDNYVVYGDQSSPTSSLVKNLSVADFKGLAPINSTASTSDLASLSGFSDDDVSSTAQFPSSSSFLNLTGVSPPGGNSPIPGGSPRGGNPLGKLLRKHQNGVPAVPFEPSLQAWEVATEDEFPTLGEVFAGLPTHVAFDIEVKMTTPSDAQRTPPEEVERVVTATLAAVDAALSASRSSSDGGGRGQSIRAVMFSSFDPEVCIEIRMRRPEFPVMFLSGGEAEVHVDSRRTSIARAIEFAVTSNLDGVILDTSVLKLQPQMIAHAKRYGLEVMTYGMQNDDEEWVQEQEKLGVHGVIVDDVERIARAYQQR